MKKMILAVLIFLLLLTPIFVNIPKVGATTTDDLWTTPALPEDTSSEPMPENYITEDYLNTTNPYSQVNPLGEETDEEGSHPLYVLIFGDEEERGVWRWWEDPPMPYSWVNWAKMQLERGDESLVANFGIDIRILGFEEWDSDDSLDSMYDLWDELEEDTEQYLRQWYEGEYWSNYVDAIIGITDQATPVDVPSVAGLSPMPELLDQGRIFVLLKWQAYWMDDNLVQHEVSHLYYASDHPGPQPPAPCCAMAYHPHYQTWIWEDDLWWVFNNVHCAYTSYSWCTNCSQTIQQNSGRYPLRTLTISASSGGTTNPTPGTYIYDNGGSVAVAASAYSHYYFDHWLLDGVDCGSDPTITVTMDSDHNLEAYFSFYNNAPNTPSTPSGHTYGYEDVQYFYCTSTTDPDGDDVKYTYDWGDGSTTTTGLRPTGEPAGAYHTWGSMGTYEVKVKAQDEYGLWSDWSGPLTVNIYKQPSGPGGCPTLLVWNGSNYVDYGVIDIHNPTGEDVVREVPVQAEDVSVSGYKVKFTLREGWEGLNYSHSLIDQVKLYAVDSEGNRYLCPLIKAEHNEQGKVLLNLLFSDDYRIDTYLMDTIDLTFKVPCPTETIENFTFIIEGHNPYKV